MSLLCLFSTLLHHQVTFIELIKNPVYKFWKHEFVRSAPELIKLFDSVSRSCLAQQKAKTPQLTSDNVATA